MKKTLHMARCPYATIFKKMLHFDGLQIYGLHIYTMIIGMEWSLGFALLGSSGSSGLVIIGRL